VILAMALLGMGLRGAPQRRGEHGRPVAVHRPEKAAAAAGLPLVVPGLSGSASRYVNPLASAHVRPKRIDQGFDYKGSGTLTAIGDGVITEVATTDTGWPGAFIEYQLVNGPAARWYVFYAEGLIPAAGLAPGQAVTAGQPIATIIPGDPSGIEIGWGAGVGTETYAALAGEWSARADADSIPTAAGRNFSALIASLGGPPGRVGG
jgi:hypothetical protein